jgi:hypothetical protein
MLRHLKSVILALTALGTLCAGPVAACICADEPPKAMPCCPDDPEPSEVFAACDPASAEVLRPSVPDLTQPAIVAAPSWLMQDPPAPAESAPPTPYSSPPIYLATLRLRI